MHCYWDAPSHREILIYTLLCILLLEADLDEEWIKDVLGPDPKNPSRVHIAFTTRLVVSSTPAVSEWTIPIHCFPCFACIRVDWGEVEIGNNCTASPSSGGGEQMPVTSV